MTARSVPITEALRSRMQLTARLLAERVDPGRWHGYNESESLVARLTRSNDLGNSLTAEYWRTSDPKARIVLGFLDMTDIQTKETVSETVIEDGIEERFVYDFDIPAGVTDKEERSHTFSKTTSFEEAAKKAWEAGGKAALTASYGGIGGSIEAYGKYGEELADKHASATTVSDTIVKNLTFTGPCKVLLEAYRCRQRREKIVRAQCNIDGKVYFMGAASMWEFTTYQSQFLPIARRTSDDSVYGYDEFMNKPVSDSDLDRLEAAPDAIIEFPVHFDCVTTQHLKPLED